MGSPNAAAACPAGRGPHSAPLGACGGPTSHGPHLAATATHPPPPPTFLPHAGPLATYAEPSCSMTHPSRDPGDGAAAGNACLCARDHRIHSREGHVHKATTSTQVGRMRRNGWFAELMGPLGGPWGALALEEVFCRAWKLMATACCCFPDQVAEELMMTAEKLSMKLMAGL